MSQKRKVFKLFAIAAILISVIGFIVDLRSTLTYPGSDLRSRVVGARLMLEGIDPYVFKWQPSLSERFYDPLDNPTELISKLSVPPTVLTLHSTMAGLSYLHQKIIWLFVQWIALVGTVSIFIKASQSQAKTYLILGISFFLPIAYFGVSISTQVNCMLSTLFYSRSPGFSLTKSCHIVLSSAGFSLG